ncbi:unnamed protein product [Symbiodinium sp. CCMP2592]|nr:unnamed protein product [Symbiodinium sp. CCMP2592]
MCKASPATCHRSGVLQQLETWKQYQQTVQLFFVEQLALELSSQLDLAGDASSRCREISDRNEHPQPPVWPHGALVYTATDNGQSLIWGSASTACSEISGPNEHPPRPALPHAALVGAVTENATEKVTENGEHRSPMAPRSLVWSPIRTQQIPQPCKSKRPARRRSVRGSPPIGLDDESENESPEVGQCNEVTDLNQLPQQPAFPHAAVVSIAIQNGEHRSQSLTWGSASTASGSSEDASQLQCSEISIRNKHAPRPALPNAALVGTVTENATEKVTENGEHCSPMAPRSLIRSPIRTPTSACFGLQPQSANDEPPTLAAPAKDERKRKSWGSASTRSGSSQDELEELRGENSDHNGQILDPFDPSRNLLPDLLPYLSVDDILEWRVASCQTRSPRALIQHVSEMGRLDRWESMLEFSLRIQSGEEDPAAFYEEMAKDVRQQKFFECRWWCIRLARAKETHFSESDAYDIVSANLRDLFAHCGDADIPVRISAHHLVSKHGSGGLPFVQRLIAEAMLGHMEDVLPESQEISEDAWKQAMDCTGHLAYLLRTLTKPQRQKWVSQLVKALRSPESLQGRLQEDVFSGLKLLWRADDDPERSYAEADHQLKALLKRSSGRLQQQIYKLLAC